MRPEQERTADIVRAHDCDSSRLIAILQEIQAAESYLSEENMTLVADMLGISLSNFKKLEAEGAFPFKRRMVGSAVRYRNTDIVKFILSDS